MSIIQVFGQSEVRFVDHPDGKYEFGVVADDLADVLAASSGKDIARSVDGDWLGAQIMHTSAGNRTMTVIWEPGIYQLLAKSRKPQAKLFQKWLFEEVVPSIRKTGQYAINPEPQHQLPQTYLEALKALVASEEQRALAEAENAILEQANHALSEAVDELFDYSSIIRVAKYNSVSEKSFSWHRLKAASMKLGCEIKRVPCPRFGEKNLYSHDAWRLAYPGASLPETTTLVIKR